MPTGDEHWDRNRARLVVSPGAILSLSQAAKLLPIAERDARRWLRSRGLVRDLAGRPVVVWQQVMDALLHPADPPPRAVALPRVKL